MISSVATNVIVKVENIDDDDVDKNNDINDLVVPSPPVDSNSSHDDDKDDEISTLSIHELSVSPDHQLPQEQDSTPQEQDGTTEKPDQSTVQDDTTPEKPDQSSSDITSQELLPSSDDLTDDTNLLTAI